TLPWRGGAWRRREARAGIAAGRIRASGGRAEKCPEGAGAADEAGGMTRTGTIRAERGQMALDLGHTPSHAEADFIVGEGNELAYAHILAFPNWPGPLTLLVGPAKA